MRIKKQFLNEDSLAPYGFKKKILYGDSRFVEYTKKDSYVGATILIQRCSGEICVVIHGETMHYTDTVCVDNTIYYLIVDGLVEV